MDNEIRIPIPTDDDGYVLLKCEHCGNFFKVMPSDAQDDRILYVYCPSCGLTSESYVTDDVLELVENMTENIANDLFYEAVKKLEQSNSKNFKVKAGKRPAHKNENPLHSGVEALETSTFLCCNRIAKIKPLLKMTGAYCPFCGVKNYEVE